MKIYNFDQKGVYTVESEARKDNRESVKAGEDVFRIPAQATAVKPPAAKDGKVRVFNQETEKWSQVDDKTGTEFFDKVTKEKFVADSYDFDDSGLTDKAPLGVDFETWDEDAGEWVIDLSAHLSEYRDSVLYSGTSLNDLEIPTDQITQQRMTAARIKADADSDYTAKWKINGAFIDLTAPEIVAISEAILSHVQNCFTAESMVDTSEHDTISSLEEAFDNALSSL